MRHPLGRFDAAVLAILFAVVGVAEGLDAGEVVAGAVAVFVGVFLVAERRPPYAGERIPPAASVAAWSALAVLSVALAVIGERWPLALLGAVAAASAALLWRRRRAARERGLV